jgi:hypothetical protein
MLLAYVICCSYIHGGANKVIDAMKLFVCGRAIYNIAPAEFGTAAVALRVSLLHTWP